MTPRLCFERGNKIAAGIDEALIDLQHRSYPALKSIFDAPPSDIDTMPEPFNQQHSTNVESANL